MTDINETFERMIAEMRQYGDMPAPSNGGSYNNLLRYREAREKILERFLAAFAEGYRLGKEDAEDEPLPVLVNDEPDRAYIDYICPRCKRIISQSRRGQRMKTVYQCKYHDNCGQRVDWTNPKPYRCPPERQEDNNEP